MQKTQQEMVVRQPTALYRMNLYRNLKRVCDDIGLWIHNPTQDNYYFEVAFYPPGDILHVPHVMSLSVDEKGYTLTIFVVNAFATLSGVYDTAYIESALKIVIADTPGVEVGVSVKDEEIAVYWQHILHTTHNRLLRTKVLTDWLNNVKEYQTLFSTTCFAFDAFLSARQMDADTSEKYMM